MTKVYIVKEVHDYDKYFVIGVCPSRELAEKLRQRNSNQWDLEDCEITSEIYDRMVGVYYTRGYSSDKSMLESMIELFPEYSVSDIESAIYEYENRSYVGTVIEEINLFTNDTEIMQYELNCR